MTTTAPPAVTISLPLPPKELHAHAKGHWRSKSGATRRCRERAAVECVAAGVRVLHRGVASFDFYFPDKRRRDLLNVAHGCKPYVDGIVDAGVIDDDDWQHLSIGRIRPHVDRENPRVEITITGKPAEGGAA